MVVVFAKEESDKKGTHRNNITNGCKQTNKKKKPKNIGTHIKGNIQKECEIEGENKQTNKQINRHTNPLLYKAVYVCSMFCVLCSDFICSAISSVTRPRETMKFCISTQN